MNINRMQDTPLRRLARRCWPKEQHASMGAARAHLRALVKAGLLKDESRARAYRCVHCGKCHVGHLPGSDK